MKRLILAALTAALMFITTFLLLATVSSNAQNSSEYTFERGVPIGATVANVYYNSDLRRAIEAYKLTFPTLATEAVIQQMIDQGAYPNENGIIKDVSPRQQFAGTNADTPYALLTLDLEAGPWVIELPENPLLLGFINDHNQGFIENLGGIGPDKGKGGKYVILGPNFKGQVPAGYFVARSKTHKIVSNIRTVPLDGDVKKAIRAVQKVKVYPFGRPEKAASYRILDAPDRDVPLPLLKWEGTLEYWSRLHAIIETEPVLPHSRYVMGILAELGMEKGKPFNPDVRAKEILTEAAEIAHQELSISLYANRRAKKMVWPDRQWEWVPVGPFHTPTGDFGTATASDLDASDHYFWAGWGTSSAIGKRKVGRGSIYYLGYRDQAGNRFDGDKTYKLSIPGPVPAELFWSVTVYDSATRCLIETEQGRAAVRSHIDKPKVNADGSVDIYIGPKAPDGKESNWVRTIPGKGWWGAVRLYGPKKEVFDGSWRLGDFKESSH